MTFGQSILSRTCESATKHLLVAFAAAVAPDVAGPMTADTLDWVKVSCNWSSLSCFRLIIFIDYLICFPSIPPAALISSTATKSFVQLFMQLKNLILQSQNPILIVFSSLSYQQCWDCSRLHFPQAASSATLQSATNDRQIFLHLLSPYFLNSLLRIYLNYQKIVTFSFELFQRVFLSIKIAHKGCFQLFDKWQTLTFFNKFSCSLSDHCSTSELAIK